MGAYESQVTGLLGEKLGMTQVWDDNNRVVPVTVVKAGPCVVTAGPDSGHRRLQRRPARLRCDRPPQGEQAPAGSVREGRRHAAPPPRRDPHDQGLRVHARPGDRAPDVFEAGQSVDVTGTTKGKGYAGVMKRHGFKGMGASHGAHRNHRKPGSIGGCATPGRVFKGMRMAGRMGGERQTTQSLHDSRRRRRERLHPDQGCRPRPEGRPRARPYRREGGTRWLPAPRPSQYDVHVDLKDAAGEKVGTVELPAEIFDVQVNIPLIHQVVVAQLAAARQGTHDTKTRGEVRGGGRKPYRQKGTGRARQGSTRAPQFVGGGVVHGPHAARLLAAHPQEDEGRRTARCPLGPRPRGSHPRPHGPGHRRDAVDQGRARRAAHDLRAQAHPRGRRPWRRRRVEEPAQRRAGPPARRRPAEHLRRARLRRRGLHPGRARDVPRGPDHRQGRQGRRDRVRETEEEQHDHASPTRATSCSRPSSPRRPTACSTRTSTRSSSHPDANKTQIKIAVEACSGSRS